VLPLVSKRWARIMQALADVWQEACLDLPQVLQHRAGGQRRSLDLAAMTVWWQARSDRFTVLGLKRTQGSMKMRPMMTATMLNMQAASLRRLSIDVTAYGFRGSDLGILAAMQELKALDVHATGFGLDDHGAAVMRLASLLTALSRLDVGYVGDPAAALEPEEIKLPRYQELAELRSTSLRGLSVAMAGGTDDVLRLCEVPNLEECHLLADNRSGADSEFLVDAMRFAGCTKLGELMLHDLHGLSLEYDCFAALPGLHSLTLTACNLPTVPAAVAPLRTLTLLNLSRNKHLEVDETGIGCYAH